MAPITYTLSVTSPLTTGKRVKDAQKVLNGGNVFGRDFLDGPIDGEFGELTGRACIRAKYWLGYADDNLENKYGPTLDMFLGGLAQPDDAMVRRARKRELAATRRPLRVKALEESVKHLGVKESPAGSNVVLFSRWYGITGPWCAMFVTYCYVKAGSKAFVKGSRYAYVPYIVADARAGRNGLHVTKDPKPGDIVCYDWDGGVADHVGIFEEGTVASFTAIEGNTSVGNDSNGGEVMRRTRSGSQVECFVRVGK